MNKPILEKLNSFAAKQYGVEFIGEKGDLILPNVKELLEQNKEQSVNMAELEVIKEIADNLKKLEYICWQRWL